MLIATSPMLTPISRCLIPLSLFTDFQVQGTNDNSIVSKCSMSAAGYFHDPFLKRFVAKNAKRAPLINRFVTSVLLIWSSHCHIVVSVSLVTVSVTTGTDK